MAGLRWLHLSKQGMPKRLLSTPKERSDGWCHGRLWAVVLLGPVFRLQPNTHGSRRPRENYFHLRARTILLYYYAFRPQNYWSYLSKVDKQNVQNTVGKDYGSIHWRWWKENFGVTTSTTSKKHSKYWDVMVWSSAHQNVHSECPLCKT